MPKWVELILQFLMPFLVGGGLAGAWLKQRWRLDERKAADRSETVKEGIIDRQRMSQELWEMNRKLIEAEGLLINERLSLHGKIFKLENDCENYKRQIEEFKRMEDQQSEEVLVLQRELIVSKAEVERQKRIAEMNKRFHKSEEPI